MVAFTLLQQLIRRKCKEKAPEELRGVQLSAASAAFTMAQFFTLHFSAQIIEELLKAWIPHWAQ